MMKMWCMVSLLWFCIGGLEGMKLTAAEEGDNQVVVRGGIFYPGMTITQDMYGTSLSTQVALSSFFTKRTRLHLGVHLQRATGSPYQKPSTFENDDAAQLYVLGLATHIDYAIVQHVLRRLYLGLGLVFIKGREQIDFIPAAEAEGLGVLASFSPEWSLSPKLFLQMNIQFRILNIRFGSDLDIYHVNHSGTHLLLGLGYHFNKE